jgi:gp16 family phage-associated protein
MNKSIEQVKDEFSRRGISLSSWAKANGVSKNLLYQVLKGGRQCRYGQSHKIAVLLGIKDGVIDDNEGEQK